MVNLNFRYLLEQGADPFVTDTEGNIALHWAVLSGSMSSVEMLLNYGCQVNAANNIGDTPL
jgi:ankyrin repeat protein